MQRSEEIDSENYHILIQEGSRHEYKALDRLLALAMSSTERRVFSGSQNTISINVHGKDGRIPGELIGFLGKWVDQEARVVGLSLEDPLISGGFFYPQPIFVLGAKFPELYVEVKGGVELWNRHAEIAAEIKEAMRGICMVTDKEANDLVMILLNDRYIGGGRIDNTKVYMRATIKAFVGHPEFDGETAKDNPEQKEVGQEKQETAEEKIRRETTERFKRIVQKREVSEQKRNEIIEKIQGIVQRTFGIDLSALPRVR